MAAAPDQAAASRITAAIYELAAAVAYGGSDFDVAARAEELLEELGGVDACTEVGRAGALGYPERYEDAVIGIPGDTLLTVRTNR